MALFPNSRHRKLLGIACAVVALGVMTGIFREKSSPDSASVPAGGPAAAEHSAGSREEPPTANAATSAVPNQGNARALFSFVRPMDKDRLDASLGSPSRDTHYVRISQAALTAKDSPFWQAPGAGMVRLPLPSGGGLDIIIDRTDALGAARFTTVGRIAGRPRSRAVFAYNEGFLNGSVEDPELGTYVLTSATEELTQFYKVDPALVPPCGGEVAPVFDADARETLRRRTAAIALGDAAPAELPPENRIGASAGANVTVQLMMVYTQGVLSTISNPTQRSAAIQSAFDASVAVVNADLAASLISVRVQLVRVASVNYAGDDSFVGVSGLQNNMLDALRRSTDSGQFGSPMNEIHAMRDESGADLVLLVHNRPDPASIGLGYILQPPASNTNPLFGFSVVQYAYINSNHVVSHELGHNFGCVHDRENSNTEGAYSYSFGYRFTGQNGQLYHDIMAYDPGTRLGYFSNPKVIPSEPGIGRPIGVPPGQVGEADCALTIDNGGFEVAGYRLQTQAAVNPGNLVNVSTRGFVGTGEQQMIAGFVITGTQPKNMLIRASGPAIAGAPFNVPGTLADPVLQLMRTDLGTAQLMGVNDNWGDGGSGPALEAAASTVGAFAFPAGSKDAAMYISLPPGAYTPQITGKNGTTGNALVEAYEVTRNDSRVVNLSTRAYGDLGREIIGGFVVQGSVGTTKRILIRVRGPSLGALGVTLPMDDPYMTLHNSVGDLIMANDDWTTITLGGNDAAPTQQYYSENQIYATGYAPGNRREPALLVDLAPGPYTVIVSPFQDLEDVPQQIAKPGVAIVEVFEIN